MKVLMTGATGFIGRELGKTLVRAGHEIYAVSRNAAKAQSQLPFPAKVIEADLSKRPLDPTFFASIDAVIHLAGENVGDGKWTQDRKRKILGSRVDLTKNLMQSLPNTLKVFISASAVGIYGNRGIEALTESSSRGKGFLADVCEQWEDSVLGEKHKIFQARVVILRTGVVFAPYGGALMKMLTPFQMGLGGVLGNGEQWMSWIHLQDLVSMYQQALEKSEWQGIYNAVSPEAVTNRQFTKSFCQALMVNQGPNVPAIALKAIFGEMSQVILDSQNVKSQKLQNFAFQFPNLKAALADCAAPYKGGNQVFFAEQYLPLPRPQVFSFFAKAENLESITPPLLQFHMKKMSTPAIQKGTLIDYRLKLHGVPVGWQTLIEDWDPPHRFVDTQLKGPYHKWHHTHSFEDLSEGTLMRDVVRFQLPLGKLGQIFGGSFVRGDVESIFAYRQKAVPKLLKKISNT